MKTRIVKLLTAACCFCCCGCESVRDVSFTARLWNGGNYVAPPPDPKLVLSQTLWGILVQYDALYEHNGTLHRRAYYAEFNLKRVAAGQKPIFIDPAKAGPQTVIPIFTSPITNGPLPELYAVCSSDFCTFTIHRRGMILGPCPLPVFEDKKETAAQVALTPLAVTGDAGMVAAAAAALGGCLWVLAHAGWGPENPTP